MRSDSASLRPSILPSHPAEPESTDYLALDKGRLVVITPTTPQTKRGFLGALVRPRSDSKDQSSQSASPSRSRSLSASSAASSSSRSSVSEPHGSPSPRDAQANRKLLTALASYASRLKLPADAQFHTDVRLLERACSALPPQEFGRGALKIYAAAKAQASGVDHVVDTAVREAMTQVNGGRTEFNQFASAIPIDLIRASPGCHVEVHQGRLVVLQSMEGLNPDEVRLAKAIDAKLRRGDASLTVAEDQLQIKRADKGKAIMRETYAEGTAHEDGKYGGPRVYGPATPEEVTANLAANGRVLEAAVKRLKDAGVYPSLLAQFRESIGQVVESPPELFAYRLADRTKKWDARVKMVQTDRFANRPELISQRLKQHMRSGALASAEAPLLARYAQRAFELAVDQDMALQPENNRRDTRNKSLPPQAQLAPLASLSIAELTDMAIMELRHAELKPLAGSLPPLPPPLPAELQARSAHKDGK